MGSAPGDGVKKVKAVTVEVQPGRTIVETASARGPRAGLAAPGCAAA